MEQFLNGIYVIADNPTFLSAILFVASLVHSFLPFIPVETGSVFVGYLVSTGHGSLSVTILSTTFGMTLGHLIIYYSSLLHGESVFAQKPISRFFSRKHYEKMQIWFGKYGIWSLFLAKVIPGMAFCSVLCCGTFKLSRMKAIIGITGSNLAQFTCLILLGKLAGEHWKEAFALFNRIGYLTLTGIIVIVVLILLYIKFESLKR